MKTGLSIALALVVGALLAQWLMADAGYVAIRFGGHLIEMSAVTFLLVLIAGFFVVRLVIKLLSARRLWRERQIARRQERARRALAKGLLEMAEGEWEASEETFTRTARDAESPVVHYMVAARAAELQGSAQRRDEWLLRALDASTERRAPVLIMQAEMHLKHKQYQAALATLQQLEARAWKPGSSSPACSSNWASATVPPRRSTTRSSMPWAASPRCPRSGPAAGWNAASRIVGATDRSARPDRFIARINDLRIAGSRPSRYNLSRRPPP
jgi:hypothetical protein